ncbi:MAG: barstar family protein [Acutalibacteraceae bacterium]
MSVINHYKTLKEGMGFSGHYGENLDALRDSFGDILWSR